MSNGESGFLCARDCVSACGYGRVCESAVKVCVRKTVCEYA